MKNNKGWIFDWVLIILVVAIIAVLAFFIIAGLTKGGSSEPTPVTDTALPGNPPVGNPVQLPLVSITTANNTVITPGEPLPQANTTNTSSGTILNLRANTTNTSSGTILNLTNITKR